MSANYHFHIQNFVQVSHSQFQQNSTNSTQQLNSENVDKQVYQDTLNSLEELADQIELEREKRSDLETHIKTIALQLTLQKPKHSIIKESFHSITHALEGAAGLTLVAEALAKINGLM
jgi:ABC-type Fe3+-citrate transport system substrate-binding protein